MQMKFDTGNEQPILVTSENCQPKNISKHEMMRKYKCQAYAQPNVVFQKTA